MALVNFSGLQMIYGEEVLDKIKGYEFHYKQSVNRSVHLVGKDTFNIFHLFHLAS